MVTPRYCGAAVILLALMCLGGRPEAVAPESRTPKPEPIPILPAEEVWTTQFEAPPAANAWMDDERVYVPLRVQGLRVVSRKTGELLWRNGVDLSHPPLAVDGHLLLALPDEIRAVDPATGRTEWSSPLTGRLAASLTTSGGLVILISEAGEAIALRADDGQIAWRHALGSAASHAPASHPPNIVVFTLANGRVLALDGRTGKEIWQRSLPGSLSAPAMARDRVLVGSTNNFFYALDMKSGAERWRWRTGGDVVGAAAAGERVYFVSLDNVLRAVNRDNGNQLWKAAIPSRPSAPPVAFDDVVVLTGVAPRVDAYNARTGAALGSFTAPTDLEGVPLIDTTPAPFEVAIVALMRDGRLSAMRPTGLMFPDPPLAPLLKLPGRELQPDRLPRTPNRPRPTTK